VGSKFSQQEQLQEIANILTGYIKVPFALDTIPGSFMENVLAYVRKAQTLNTYDFVDVVDTINKIGWQVKSTKDTTPVTWKRAKIHNSDKLIANSYENEDGLRELGYEIINFCNTHAQESILTYHLDEIHYSRLVVFETREVLYFERLLCTKEKPIIFEPNDFIWKWSTPKVTKKKDQLQALHGYNIHTNTKWFAWHGLGENQLHFSGEKTWWPQAGDIHCIKFSFPQEDERLTQDQFMALLQSISGQ
jgi:hypothetical protein